MKESNIHYTSLNLSKEEILYDYRIANESREVSLLGRREVLTGKAKFGIFGGGKEIPQLAMRPDFYVCYRHDDAGRIFCPALWRY